MLSIDQIPDDMARRLPVDARINQDLRGIATKGHPTHVEVVAGNDRGVDLFREAACERCLSGTTSTVYGDDYGTRCHLRQVVKSFGKIGGA